MKRWKIMLILAVLGLFAFFLHVGQMHPAKKDLYRAEALQYLIDQNDADALETFAPYLSGEAELRGPEGLPLVSEASTCAGDRMIRDAERLYFIRPGSAQVIVFNKTNSPG